jgi:inhibitor of KinA
MRAYHPYTIFPLGDAALLIDFGNTIDEAVNRKVLELFHHLQRTPHPAIIDLVPAYSSLTIYYDVLSLHGGDSTPFDQLAQWLETLAPEPVEIRGRRFDIPVCYAPAFGPDLPAIAEQAGIEVQEVIARHTAPVYRVYMIGFLPGFAYMGEVDASIAALRRDSPRPSVAAGSVGIAGRQTGIYPLQAPGGWQLIGRTPLVLFHPHEEPPVLLAPGDEIKFHSITEDEFTHYQGRPA